MRSILLRCAQMLPLVSLLAIATGAKDNGCSSSNGSGTSGGDGAGGGQVAGVSVSVGAGGGVNSGTGGGPVCPPGMGPVPCNGPETDANGNVGVACPLVCGPMNPDPCPPGTQPMVACPPFAPGMGDPTDPGMSVPGNPGDPSNSGSGGASAMGGPEMGVGGGYAGTGGGFGEGGAMVGPGGPGGPPCVLTCQPADPCPPGAHLEISCDAPPPPPGCGNGVCEPGEDANSCPPDCGQQPPSMGDSNNGPEMGPPPPPAGCTFQCVPDAGPPVCNADEDCKDGFVCLTGWCTPDINLKPYQPK